MTGKQSGRAQGMTERYAAALQTLCFMEKRGRTVSAVKRQGVLRFLCNAGDFSDNGTTRAFLAMAEYLDFQKYDITLLIDGDGDGESGRNDLLPAIWNPGALQGTAL